MLLEKDPGLSKYDYQKNQVFITEYEFLCMVLGCRLKTANVIRNITIAYLMQNRIKKEESDEPSFKRTRVVDWEAIERTADERHQYLVRCLHNTR